MEVPPTRPHGRPVRKELRRRRPPSRATPAGGTSEHPRTSRAGPSMSRRATQSTTRGAAMVWSAGSHATTHVSCWSAASRERVPRSARHAATLRASTASPVRCAPPEAAGKPAARTATAQREAISASRSNRSWARSESAASPTHAEMQAIPARPTAIAAPASAMSVIATEPNVPRTLRADLNAALSHRRPSAVAHLARFAGAASVGTGAWLMFQLFASR